MRGDFVGHGYSVECCRLLNAASRFGTTSMFYDKTLWIFEAMSTFNAGNRRLRLEWSKHNETCGRSVRR